MFHEGKKEDSYSLCCGTKEGLKFIDIVKPYVEQVESMKHKIEYDLSQRTREVCWVAERRNGRHYQNEDIV